MEGTMRKYILLILGFVLCVSMAQAQGNAYVSKAVELSNSGRNKEALQQIEMGLQDPSMQRDAYAWYVKGYVLKELYKSDQAQSRFSSYRKESVAAFKKALMFDTSKQNEANIKAALKYFAVTFYNDALQRTVEMTTETENEPVELYSEFETLFDGSPEQLKVFKKEFFVKMAEGHYSLWMKNSESIHHFQTCLSYYNQVLQLDPSSCEANLNLAIVNYNQGVYMIRKLGSQSDMFEIISIQEESVKKFKLAYPYAEQAFSSCSPTAASYKTLMFIERAMGHDEQYLKLKTEFEKRQKHGEF
jgi:tetratricopeptide (TPR) repeat protein